MASTTTSTASSFTANFFLQNFYRDNRNAIKATSRNAYSQTELSYEDTRALKRAISKLSSYDYSEDENGTNIVNAIQAFAKTYNYAVESTSLEGSDISRQNRQLKALTLKFGKELKNIGISVKEDGTLSINNNILGGSSFKEIRNVFSNESDFIRGIRNITKRMHNSSHDEIYTYMTGTGGRLNISL